MPPQPSAALSPLEFSRSLLSWFDENMRPLPWRTSYAPYEVWISEIMLQQTQMERGVSFFLRWMERFPSVESVAEAPEEAILRCWEGLGYYRRAHQLHAAAKAMVSRHGGSVPRSREELLALPGIGEYTAAAILSIAYGQDIALVDANVERVFSRMLDIDSPVKQEPAHSRICHEAQRLLPSGSARRYNQALMELGALVCRKQPQCGQCPVCAWCLALKNGTVSERPLATARVTASRVVSTHAVITIGDDVLLRQRAADGLWGNMWEFPGIICTGEDEKSQLIAMLGDLGFTASRATLAGQVATSYTSHRLTAHFYLVSIDASRLPAQERFDAEKLRLIPRSWLGELAMPSHHRRMAQRLFDETSNHQP